jgi:Pentapeptide repeats (8 copies)/Pentapeptide repeats (9 copies)
VRRLLLTAVMVAVGAAAVGASSGSSARQGQATQLFTQGNLLVSRSVYDNNPANVTVGQTLPPGCTSGCGTAIADGTYPTVFNNDTVDGSFGITSKIYLDQITTGGSLVSSVEVPNSLDPGVASSSDQMVTSFPSKSEIALNLATDGESVSFMGYLAPVDALDVSNTNTDIVDPTNPVPGSAYRVVGQLDSNGHFHFTKTNAYSGNNGRAAILNEIGNANVLYTSGNAGNGSDPQPNGIIIGAGAQIMKPQAIPLSAQHPGNPTPVGAFNITQLGKPHDKIGKDTNFRGLTISNGVLYYTKGSGGNGVNTVYFVDPTGATCSDANGVGLPSSSSLPIAPLAYNPAVLQTKGLDPNNMCVLNGFPTALKSKTSFPFGIWFANPTTLYVADEGNGDNTYSTATGVYSVAAAQTTAGLQKWTFSGGSWHLAYTLSSGLQLGTPYTVSGYPTGTNSVTGKPWAPATDGLRNITGRVNGDGTVTVYGITSTVSGSGDQGADPNKLVTVTDTLSATSPGSETFTTVRTAAATEVLRGISVVPVCGAAPNCDQHGQNKKGDNLANAQLQGVNLQGANLQSANLQAANLHDAILQGANLQGVDGNGANFVDSSLQGVNLQKGTYASANFEGANLQGSNLQGDDLTGTKFGQAMLDGSNLQGTNLTNADLTGASTKGANLNKITWSSTTCPDGTNSDTDGGTCLHNL